MEKAFLKQIQKSRKKRKLEAKKRTKAADSFIDFPPGGLLINIRVNRRERELLTVLLDKGIFGSTYHEVVERIVDRFLIDAVWEGKL